VAEIGSGLRPPPLPATSRKSGQFICYNTGQVYLLPTEGDPYPDAATTGSQAHDTANSFDIGIIPE
jgi:hypothetical protein